MAKSRGLEILRYRSKWGILVFVTLWVPIESCISMVRNSTLKLALFYKLINKVCSPETILLHCFSWKLKIDLFTDMTLSEYEWPLDTRNFEIRHFDTSSRPVSSTFSHYDNKLIVFKNNYVTSSIILKGFFSEFLAFLPLLGFWSKLRTSTWRIAVEVTDFCWSEVFLSNWQIFVEVTDFCRSERFLSKWQISIEVTDFRRNDAFLS